MIILRSTSSVRQWVKVYFTTLLFTLCSFAGFATTYYNKANSDLTIVANWGINADGSGTTPADFATDGDIFNLNNNPGVQTGGAWQLGASGGGPGAGVTLNVNYTGAPVVLNGDLNIEGKNSHVTTLFVATGATLDMGSNAITDATGGFLGVNTYTNNGTIITANTSATPLPAAVSTWGGTIVYDAAIGGQTVMAATYNNLTNSNTSGINTLAGAVTISAGGTLTLSASSTLANAAFAISNAGNIAGTGTESGTGVITMTASGTTVSGATISNLASGISSGTITATGNLTVTSSLSTATGGTLDMSTFSLGGTPAAVTNNGTIKTASTSAAPIPSGQTWGGTVIYYAASGGQTVMAGAYNNLTLSNSSGTSTASGNISAGGTLTTTLGGTLNLSTYVLSSVHAVTNNGTIETQNTSAAPIPANLTWGGTVLYDNTTTNQTISNGTYNNLTLGGASGTVTYTPGNNLTVNGVLTTALSTTTLNMASHTLTGTLTPVNNGTIETQDQSAVPIPSGKTWGGLVEYNSTGGDQHISAGTYNNLSIGGGSGSHTGSLSGAITVGGTLTINATTTLSTSAPSYQINIEGNWVNNGAGFTANSGKVIFDGTLAQSIGGSTVTSFNNLTVSNTGAAVSVITNTNVSDTLNMNGAGTILNPSATVIINNLTSAGVITGNGTIMVTRIASVADLIDQYKLTRYILGSMTVNYTGAGAQTVNDTTHLHSYYGTLKTSTSGTKTLQGVIQTNNDINIGVGTTLDVSASNFTINDGGNWINNGTFTCENGAIYMVGTVTGLTLSGNMTGTSEFHNLVFLTAIGTPSWSFSNDAEVGATFNVSSGTVTAPAGTLTVHGNWWNSGVFSNNGGAVVFNFTSSGNAINGTVNMTGTSKFNNLTFTGSGGGWTFITHSAEVAGNFIMGTGTTLVAPSTSLLVAGTWSNSGTYTHNSGTVTFDGSTAQAIGGSSNTIFNNFILNNSAGAALGASETVNNTLTLTSGSLTIGSSTLALGNTAAVVGGGPFSASKMIIADGGGAVRKNATTAAQATYTFPVGSNNGTAYYSPITLTFTGGTYAGYSSVGVVNTEDPNNKNTTNYLKRYWTVAQSGYSSYTAVVAATYVASDVVGATGSVLMGKWDGAAPWARYAGSNSAGVLTSPSITFTSSDFTGINNANPTVTVNPASATICSGSSQGLTAAGTGDASFTYTWSPATGLSATSGTTVTASPTVTTTYTVTAADGNGFTATNTSTVTVTSSPNVSNFTAPSATSPCLGSASTATVNSTTIGAGTYTVTYNLSAPNAATGLTATLTMGASNGTFNIPSGALTGAGATTFTITSIANATGCSSTVSSSNTASFTVNALPNVSTFTPPSATSPCLGAASTATVNSGTLGAGTFTATYNLSGANSSSGNTATLTMGVSSGTFAIPSGVLASLGATTATITAISNASGCSSPVSSSNIASFTVNAIPNVSTFTSPSATSPCLGSASTATVNSTTLGAGTFTATYNLSGANTSSGNTATLTMGVSNGTFAIPSGSLASAGATTVTITSISNASGCSSTVSGSNTASFNVNTNPNVSNFTSTSATTQCLGYASTTTVNSTTLGSGTFTAIYNLGGANASSGNTATLTMGVGNGTFAIPSGILASSGATTVTITAISNGSGCSSAVSIGNTASFNVNANPTPYAVTGGGSYCSGGAGVHTGLANSDAGINYSLYRGGTTLVTTLAGTGVALDFGLRTAANTFTVSAANASTGCASNMSGSAVITIIPAPTAYTVTGGGGYCAGGTGVHVGLISSDAGVNYQLYNTAPVGGPVAGTGAALDFGLETTACNFYTVVATNTATGCTKTMTGTVAVIVNALPWSFTVTGGGGYCTGGAGVAIGLSSTVMLTNYQLYIGGLSSGSPIAGTGTTISFGSQTAAGTYTVIATNTVTGCVGGMSGSTTVTVNPLPAVYSVTGGGSYCLGGSGVHIGVSSSDVGANYSLYNGTTLVGTVPGTGVAIDFGLQTATGTYTIVAVNAAGCPSNMTGSAVVSVNSLPAAYAVTGGGTICSGATGVIVGLASSDIGVSYQLYGVSPAPGSPVAGTGSAISFGPQTIGGTYTVVATNNTTGCTSNMTGSAIVVVNPAPPVALVTGGGSYCLGSSGANVGLAGSCIGVNYQLYLGAATVGSPVAGVGYAFNFGLQTAIGTYTVVATNSVTGCTSAMAGSAIVNTSAPPAAYTITGGGSYCAGGYGVHVYLSGSDVGVNYTLYFSGIPVSSTPVSGPGIGIDFGPLTAAGIYGVLATDATTGCATYMTGSATITVNPLPNAGTVTGPSSVNDGANIALSDASGGGVWSSSDVTIATVGPSTGVVTGVSAGYANIFYTVTNSCGTAYAVATIAELGPAPEQQTAVTSGNTTICVGSTTTLTNSVSGGTWSSGNDNIAAIDAETGVVHGYSAGIAAITYTLVNTVGTSMVFTPVVVNAVPDAVTISSKQGTSITSGQQLTLNAEVNNGSLVRAYQWFLNNEAVSGATLATFTSNSFTNNDKVACEVYGECDSQPVTGLVVISVSDNVTQTQIKFLSNADIRVLPNPNKGTFMIKGTLSTTEEEEISVNMTNVLGQVVYTNKITARNGEINEPVQLTNLAANGMYLLTLYTGAENKVFHVVIEQ